MSAIQTHIKSLYNDAKYSDVVLVTSTGNLHCHRSVLVAVPYFADMLADMKLTNFHVSLELEVLARFTRFLYGFPIGECLPDTVQELLRVIANVKVAFDCDAFTNEAWKRVLEMRRPEKGKPKMSLDDRATTIRFAAQHKLPIRPYMEDGDALPEVTYHCAAHLITSHGTEPAKVIGAVVLCAVKWMEYHKDQLDDGEALATLCRADRWNFCTSLRARLIALSKESTLNVPAYRLIITVLSKPPSAA
jgi:hypothetical protein